MLKLDLEMESLSKFCFEKSNPTSRHYTKGLLDGYSFGNDLSCQGKGAGVKTINQPHVAFKVGVQPGEVQPRSIDNPA